MPDDNRSILERAAAHLGVDPATLHAKFAAPQVPPQAERAAANVGLGTPPQAISISPAQQQTALSAAGLAVPALAPVAAGFGAGNAVEAMTPAQREAAARLAYAHAGAVATGPATPLMLARAIPSAPPTQPAVAPVPAQQPIVLPAAGMGTPAPLPVAADLADLKRRKEVVAPKENTATGRRHI